MAWARADTTDSLTNVTIALINCEEPDASAVLVAAASRDPAAVVLYSTRSDRCEYEAPAEGNFTYARLYTMTSSSASAQWNTTLSNPTGNQPSSPPALISLEGNPRVPGAAGNTGSGSGGAGGGGGGNTLTSSPTTAVAMIILYSITGVITALFLVIIITGAIRAHRHPERYGPRSGINGRPRQSRAKGIARAMLDTLPIVKFGEKDETEKPVGDVELGRAAGAQNESEGSAGGGGPSPTSGDAAGQTDSGVEKQPGEDNRGVSDAIDAVTAVGPSSDKSGQDPARRSEEEGPKEGTLGCSICTEDFVKGEDVRVLPCNHKYHPECIDPWLLNVSGTCPLW